MPVLFSMRNFSTNKALIRGIGTFSAALALATLTMTSSQAAVSVGSKCSKSGAKSGTLVCTKKAGKLVWARAAAATATTKAGQAATVTTTATAAAAGTSSASIDGTWKAIAPSVVGYRVKEVINGQSTEGVGRTSGVTGTMTMSGTKISAVALTADLTKLKSDSDRRDRQVQGRILETATHPTATVALAEPIDLGSLPADKVEVAVKAKVVLTVKGISKTIPTDIKARRDGGTIQVNGQIPVTFTDFNIEDPSFRPAIVAEQNGLLEFLVVFGR